jgi:hypothetical protein
MKLVVLVVALALGMSGGCKKKKDDEGQYSGGGNPTVYGAEQAVRKSVERTVTAAELHDLHLFINTVKGASGQMPTSQQTWEALNRPDGNRKLVQLIQEGLVILVPSPQEEGLWAYDKNVKTTNGMVLTNNGVERVNANEFSTRFPGY